MLGAIDAGCPMRMRSVLLALAGVVAVSAHAQSGLSPKQSEVMTKLLATYAERAKLEVKNDKLRGTVSDQPFTAEAGRKFYLVRRTWQSTDYTCSGCHTEDPRKAGRHIETKQPIKPLAPIANPDRFIDAGAVEANFVAHCMDLHERDCTSYEKGNVLTYLMSVR
jgi:hypothetical protein